MIIVNVFKEFFNPVCLAGIIILTRFASKGWQIFIGTALIILGLLSVYNG